jgi:hypothetical protein
MISMHVHEGEDEEVEGSCCQDIYLDAPTRDEESRQAHKPEG